ncbi:hypothetical protein FKP32DRAFT_378247 [Trametes sanguinea]|nr:hypothetical protein FKP32DRAFT_378247 [Trametes sanguinea]
MLLMKVSLGVWVKERTVDDGRTVPTVFPLGAVGSYYIDAPSCERVVRSVVGGTGRSRVSSRVLACTGETEGSSEFDSGGIGKRLLGRGRAEDAEHAQVVGDCDREGRRDEGERTVRVKSGVKDGERVRDKKSRCWLGIDAGEDVAWAWGVQATSWKGSEGGGDSELPRGRCSRRVVGSPRDGRR